MLPVRFDAKFRQMTNVPTHQLKPSEPAAMDVGYSNDNRIAKLDQHQYPH
jgi:hypothetical protein